MPYGSLCSCFSSVKVHNMDTDYQTGQLVINELSYKWQRTNGDSFQVGPLTATIEPGQQIVIVGESGAGKSTLMKLLAGLLQPDQGTIYLDGKQVLGPDFKLVAGDERILLMDQHPVFSPGLTLKQILLHELRHYEKEWSGREADRLLELCGLSRYSNQPANQLSGGEQQRLALAMTLATHPTVLLLDEPVSKLDHHLKSTLVSAVRDIIADEGVTAIWTLHEPELTLAIADLIWVMQDGQLVQTGTAKQVYFNPITARVAGLLGDFNIVHDDLQAELGISHRKIIRPSELELTPNQNGPWLIIKQVFLGSGYSSVLIHETHQIWSLRVFTTYPLDTSFRFKVSTT